MSGQGPTSTRNLLPSESRFAAAMQQLGFGRFEVLRIQSGELVLNPWPTTVQGIKFGSEDPVTSRTPPGEFELKRQVVQLFNTCGVSTPGRSAVSKCGTASRS